MIDLGGGLLICKTALQWLNDSDSSMGGKENRTVDPVALSKISSQIFYPLTFPISIGPGTISVIFTLMASASTKGAPAAEERYQLRDYRRRHSHHVFDSASVSVPRQKIVDKPGSSGSMIINKMIAFFTFCVGIQIVVEGIVKIFHLNIL